MILSSKLGISTFDSSISGLGGCPFAPGAAGNIATERLIYMLDGLGLHAVSIGIHVHAVPKL